MREYEGFWKPKHHFCTHLAVELLRFGAMRGYWCMAHEGFNRVVKGAASLSQWRSEDIFVIEHWVMKSGRKMRGLLREEWLTEYDAEAVGAAEGVLV